MTLSAYQGANSLGSYTNADGASSNLKTSVAANTTLTERDLTFKFQAVGMTDAQEIPGKTVKQAGATPTLTVSSTTVDLDDDDDLSFATNAHWTLQVVAPQPDGNTPATRMLTAAQLTSTVLTTPTQILNFPSSTYTNTEYMQASPTRDYLLSFTPYSPATGDPEAAGSTLQTTLTLATTDHDASPVSHTITLQRSAVGYWNETTGITFTPASGTLPATNATVTARAYTNQAWWLNGDNLTPTGVIDKPAHANDATNTHVLTIADNTKSMASAGRTVKVWGNKAGEIATDAYTGTYTQSAPTISAAIGNANSGDIPRLGGESSSTSKVPDFSFTGTYDGSVTIKSYVGTTPVGSKEHDLSSDKTNLVAMVEENKSTWDKRTITFKYVATGESTESSITTNTEQLGYNIGTSTNGTISIEAKSGSSCAITITSSPAAFPTNCVLRGFTSTSKTTQITSDVTCTTIGTKTLILNSNTPNTAGTMYIYAYSPTTGYTTNPVKSVTLTHDITTEYFWALYNENSPSTYPGYTKVQGPSILTQYTNPPYNEIQTAWNNGTLKNIPGLNQTKTTKLSVYYLWASPEYIMIFIRPNAAPYKDIRSSNGHGTNSTLFKKN
jgi:hypothetical protein